MKKLTPHQIDVLKVLYDDGEITTFDDGTVYLDDVDGNTLPFRKDTFKKLLSKELIVYCYSPALGVECYGITDKGTALLRLSNSN